MRYKGWIITFVVSTLVIAGFIKFSITLYKVEKRSKIVNITVAEGVYEEVEYLQDTFSSSTVIKFENGSAYVLTGMYQIPYPKGTKIKVLHNGYHSIYGRYKIEEDK